MKHLTLTFGDGETIIVYANQIVSMRKALKSEEDGPAKTEVSLTNGMKLIVRETPQYILQAAPA